MKNIKLIFSTALLVAGFTVAGVINQQVQAPPPTQTYKISVGQTIPQPLVQPMRDLDQLVQHYAQKQGRFPQSLAELSQDGESAEALLALKQQYQNKVGFLDGHLLLQSPVQDRHLMAGQFNEGLVLYQAVQSLEHPAGYRILRSNRIGDLYARQDMPLSYSNWLEPGKYLNLSLAAHKNPIIVS